MKTIQKNIFVTDDGNEFIGMKEAVRHERQVRALARVEKLLFRMPDMKSARSYWGDDAVNEVLTAVSEGMVAPTASRRLAEIFGQLEEGDPAAGPGSKGAERPSPKAARMPRWKPRRPPLAP